MKFVSGVSCCDPHLLSPLISHTCTSPAVENGSVVQEPSVANLVFGIAEDIDADDGGIKSFSHLIV